MFSYLFLFSGEHVRAAQLHGSWSALYLRNMLNVKVIYSCSAANMFVLHSFMGLGVRLNVY